MKQTKTRFHLYCPIVILFVFCGIFLELLFPERIFAEAGSPDSVPKDKVPVIKQKLGGAWTGSVDLIGEYNPQGIDLSGGVDYRNSYRYSEEYETVSAYWQTGVGLDINPSYVQPSVSGEWMPWLPIILRLQYDGYYFFGANGGLLSFASPQEPFGDSARKARKGTEETGFGQRLLFQPTVQLKAGSLILRNQSDVAWYRFPGRGPYFLELEYDTLLKDGDHLFANRTQVLTEIGESKNGVTVIGPFYEVVHAEAANLIRKRLGLLWYTERGPKIGFFDTTRYFGQVGYDLEDPNRGHQVFFIIGVGGDFGMK